MSLAVTVTRGYTMVAGVKPTVADWNAGFLPSVTIAGSVGASDIADDAITFASLNANFILSGTEITSLGSSDKFLVGSVANSDNRVITFQNTLKSISAVCSTATAFTSFYDDQLLFWEAEDTLPNRMGIGRFFEQAMSQAPELTATATSDCVLVHDDNEADGVQVRRVRLDNLLPDIITAETINNPTQIVVNAKGLITSISATEGAIVNTSAELTLPTTAGTAGDEVVWAHGLTGTPMEVHVWLKCQSTEAATGYQAGDIIDASAIKFDVGTADLITGYVVLVDATNVTLIQPNSVGADPWVTKKDDGSEAAIDTSKWKAIIRARL